MENLETLIKIIDWKIINMAFKFLNETGKNHENLGYEIWNMKKEKYQVCIINSNMQLIVKIFFDLVTQMQAVM